MFNTFNFNASTFGGPTAPGAPKLLEAIRGRLAGIEGLAWGNVLSGSPGVVTFPFIVINMIRADPTYNSKRFYEEGRMYQVTTAALDPDEAEAIGTEANHSLMRADGDFPKLVFDDGFEIDRVPRGWRDYDQPGAGPDGATVFFRSFDVVLNIDRIM
jgi:hypothetical protein